MALTLLPRPVDRASVLEELRARVGATGRVQPGRLSCAHEGLDAWIGGWPSPGVSEIVGAPGTGRMALILPALAALTRAGRPVIVVDPGQQLHPPGCRALDMRSVLLVRPPPDQTAWTAEQVARSGAVEAMVLLDPPPAGRSGLRLARAAEAGRTTVLLITSTPDPDLPAALRLRTEGWDGATLRVRCVRGPGRVEGVRQLGFGARMTVLPM